MKTRTFFAVMVLFSTLVSGCASGISAIHSNYPPGTPVKIECVVYADFYEATNGIIKYEKMGWRPKVTGWQEWFPKPQVHVCYETAIESTSGTPSRPLSPPPVSPAAATP